MQKDIPLLQILSRRVLTCEFRGIRAGHSGGELEQHVAREGRHNGGDGSPEVGNTLLEEHVARVGASFEDAGSGGRRRGFVYGGDGHGWRDHDEGAARPDCVGAPSLTVSGYCERVRRRRWADYEGGG